jgi:hypothetical protein
MRLFQQQASRRMRFDFSMALLRTPALLAASCILLGAVLSGCKTNPADMYRTGYDKRLTEETWAARAPDEAVVVIGGSPSVWQKAGETGYAFETRPRFTEGWTVGYDVALVKAGTYQLQTIVGQSGSFADLGGYSGLGAASGPVIASFDAGPGQIVYVGNLNAQVEQEVPGQCWVDFKVKDGAAQVLPAFAKQVPYVKEVPKSALMTIEESFIRFPCGRDR